MFRVPITWLAAVFLWGGFACANAAEQPWAAASTSAYTPAAQPNSSPDLPSDDENAAHELLALANQAREQAGVAPLQFNRALSQAASAHTAKMAIQKQLSHQFSGEPALFQRLTTSSDLRLGQTGENVAFAPGVEQVHEALMASPHHRENLLNPAYNMAGISVVRAGKLVYVTQDFAHSLPSYSAEQADDAVVHAVSDARTHAGVASLRRTAMTAAHKTACSMAQSGSLNGPQLEGRRELRYASYSPAQLPEGAAQAVSRDDVAELSVGTCYGQTQHDTPGMFYVELVFK